MTEPDRTVPSGASRPRGALSNRYVVEEVAASTVKPSDRQQRRHPERQLVRLQGAIEKFGQLPILVNGEGDILDGHAVYEACQRLGRQSISVIRVEGLNGPEQRALMLTLNRLSEDAQWDFDIVGDDIRALALDASVDFQIEITGFDQVFLDGVMMEQAKDVQDEVPDAPAQATSQLGDVWQAGRHRIACGDSTQERIYERLLHGEVVRMVIADVPYNLGIKANVSGLGRVQHDEFAMASGEMTRAAFVEFQTTVMRLCKQNTVSGGLHYYFIDWRHVRDQIEAGESVFGVLKQVAVWSKENGGMGSFYRSRHELITIWKVGEAAIVNNFGLGQSGRYRSNVWEYAGYSSLGKGREEALSWHPTVKPLAMIIDAVLDVTLRDDLVLDAFGGSGTTMIACERTGRRARLIEIEPKFVDVTLRRFLAATGEEPVLEATGEPFSAVEARRAADAAVLEWEFV